MLVWSVASQKGGVGKTTTVASLSGWLYKEHARVLLIDTDPHASLTSYLGFDDKIGKSLYDIYANENLTKDDVLNCISHTDYQGLDIIVSSMTLATVDRQLSGRTGVGRILTKALSFIEDCYDVVIIDCPPVLGALMVNALVASTLILVPTQTEFLSLKGLAGMVRTFGIMQRADQSAKIEYKVIPTMYDRRTRASNQSLEFLLENYKDNIWDKFIPIDTQFRESSSRGIPLPLMDSKSKGALAYQRLLVDMLKFEQHSSSERITPTIGAILKDFSQSTNINITNMEDIVSKMVKDDLQESGA